MGPYTCKVYAQFVKPFLRFSLCPSNGIYMAFWMGIKFLDCTNAVLNKAIPTSSALADTEGKESSTNMPGKAVGERSTMFLYQITVHFMPGYELTIFKMEGMFSDLFSCLEMVFYCDKEVLEKINCGKEAHCACGLG